MRALKQGGERMGVQGIKTENEDHCQKLKRSLFFLTLLPLSLSSPSPCPDPLLPPTPAYISVYFFPSPSLLPLPVLIPFFLPPLPTLVCICIMHACINSSSWSQSHGMIAMILREFQTCPALFQWISPWAKSCSGLGTREAEYMTFKLP